MSLISRRKPSLTDPESGNRVVTSGSNWTVRVGRLRP
jgi:hypothetical protein